MKAAQNFPTTPSAPRSRFLLVLGWIVIGASALLVPISVISLAMVVTGGSGTSHATFGGGLLIIGGPPATLLAGIGLLRRWRWAYGYAILALAAGMMASARELGRRPAPPTTTYSASGTPTTVYSSPSSPLVDTALITILGGLLFKLLTRRIRAEFGATRIATPDLPPLLPTRNTPPPVAGPGTAALADDPLPSRASIDVAASRQGHQGKLVLILVIVGLLVISGTMAWLVQRGASQGQTYLPSKVGSQRRMVFRQEEPALFWTCLGLYGILGAGTLGLALWGARAALRLPRG